MVCSVVQCCYMLCRLCCVATGCAVLLPVVTGCAVLLPVVTGCAVLLHVVTVL